MLAQMPSAQTKTNQKRLENTQLGWRVLHLMSIKILQKAS